jgi:hypothetical protein
MLVCQCEDFAAPALTEGRFMVLYRKWLVYDGDVGRTI